MIRVLTLVAACALATVQASHLSTILTSGVPAPFSFPAVNTPTVFFGDFGYQINVPAGATRLEVRLGSVPSTVQFAIVIRRGQDISASPLTGDYPVIVGQNPVVVTTTSNPPLREGIYFIGIAILSSPVPVTGTVTATVTTGGGGGGGGGGTGPTVLSSGVAANFSLNPVSTPTLFMNAYRIDVPAGAGQLQIRLQVNTGIQAMLHVRFGRDVEISGGRAVSDYSGQDTVAITPSSTPPLQPGSYFIAIAIVTTGRAIQGSVTATISTAPPPAAPAVAVSISSLAFAAVPGANPPSQTFTVRNSGGGTLNFQVTATQAWIGVSPANGSSTGSNVTITVTINVAGLGVGSHTGEIRVTGGGTATIQVQLTIAAAGPQVSSAGAVNAASSARNAAPELILSLYGSNLASTTAVAETTPLPVTLGGTSVKIRDSAGVERLALLFFVSAGQINLAIPPGTAPGTATITVTRDDGRSASATIQIDPVAPGLFSANADGKGVAAALAIRAGADGSQTLAPVFECPGGAGSCRAVPLDLGAESDQLILLLFGTGIRGRSNLAAVRATVGGANSEVLFAGPQGAFVGLDQVNVRIGRSLLGAGEVDVVLTVDGRGSNTVRVSIGGTPPPPRISSLNPTFGMTGQTLATFTISGQNLGGARSIEFSPAGGVTVTNLRATPTSVTAQVAIAASAPTGIRNVSVVTSGGQSNALSFDVRSSTAPPVRPAEIHSVNRRSGRAGETITDFTITGANLAAVTAIEFASPAGITVSELRPSDTMLTATISIDAGASTGFRTFRLISPGGTPSPSFYIFNIHPAGPAGTFTISNLRVGAVSTSTNRTVIPITVDFEDPGGAATSGPVDINFNINRSAIHGFGSSNPEGVTPGQTSGTLRLTLNLSNQLRSGLSLLLDITLTNNRGVESNPVTATFQTP
jgi:uncharacterized protein (TIGR03437 family)